jgi:hypothetical protein
MRCPADDGDPVLGGFHGGVWLADVYDVPLVTVSGFARSEIAMAEIRVEPRRRSLAWLWILLALIVVGGLVYYFLYYRNGSV